MKKVLTIIGVMVLSAVMATCRTAAPKEPVQFTVQGNVVDAKTRRPVANAEVLLEHSNVGTLSDREGAFMFRALGPPGKYQLVARYIGYHMVRRELRVREGGLVQLGAIELSTAPLQLDDMVVAYCRRYRTTPSDTVGATVRMSEDSQGTYWEVCRPPKR